MAHGKAIPIMIQGTHSDAGKSILVTALCRIFAQDGFRTAPFKSQNMALNSYITLDGKEIGRSQGIQAEAAETVATTEMNPILIKPTRDNEAQIVVHGKPLKSMKAQNYRSDYYDTAKIIIEESYQNLASSFERIVIEGAGSPAEVNLNDRELVNMSIAKMADAPVLLVGDIDKGGVFASLVGTLQLLSPEDRNRVVGVIINKFRGDLSLLEPGLTWFEKYTGKPILGVIPYINDLLIDAEDSLSLSTYSKQKDIDKEIDIAVINFPRISNFTDIDPFLSEKDTHVRLVENARQLEQPDIIILPGSKNTIEDLLFLRAKGLEQEIIRAHQNGAVIFGICGGYQMLGDRIEDPFQVESKIKSIAGLKMLQLETLLTNEKTTVRSTGTIQLFGVNVKVAGYEIHMGTTTHAPQIEPLIQLNDRKDGSKNSMETCIGTYFHGIFHNDEFRGVFLNHIRKKKGLQPFLTRESFEDSQNKDFNRLADHVRSALDIEHLYEIMEQFQQRKRESK
ncbi:MULTISPECIES: cobyric acid synthase [Metabacillus]|uniref:Cobyric acid synthase n=2 Tax=Metabacillus TaxID=2675233 RepID=A0A179SMI4_9BACI|nr:MULTISPECIES: cobyric acid synthase [Metabacillus]OAS82867.1 cobyric acid synthase CobQ [Metabacillus litoralis]QNF30312.1 cobyric acid synthase [Metabacillus sp. KUDC1714]